jgi:hemerythrin-like metal-binding protein
MNAILDVNGPIEWHDGFALGYAPMDEIHQEFVDIVAQMQIAPNEDLAQLLDEFIAHAKAHFDEENAWMVKSQFPPRACHIEQHNAVLNSAHEVQQLLKQGDFGMCRKFTQALVDWFPNHAAHLDSALAHWMFKLNYGGKPVVLRTMNASKASMNSEI